MISFHITYDLEIFGEVKLCLPKWYWNWIPELIGSLFLLVVGVSTWLDFDSLSGRNFRSLIRRGAKLCAVALAITAVTLLATPQRAVYFGIIHCIGFAVLLSYPFLRRPKYNLVLGLIVIFAGVLLSQFRFPFSALMWLGFTPQVGTGGDWYPLVPWFGFVLIGIFIGEKVYSSGRDVRCELVQMITENKSSRGLAFLGRHALVIYLIHQPILIGIILLLRKV